MEHVAALIEKYGRHLRASEIAEALDCSLGRLDALLSKPIRELEPMTTEKDWTPASAPLTIGGEA